MFEHDMAKKIFICYRREPSLPDESWAGRLRDHLAQQFGEDRVFRDVDNPNQLANPKYWDTLSAQIAESFACIVVIGPKWTEEIPKLFNSKDPVRREISESLSGKLRIIPIAVGGSAIPSRDQLPEDLRELVEFDGLTVTNDNAKQSFETLVKALQASAPPPGGRAGPGGVRKRPPSEDPPPRKFPKPILVGGAVLVAAFALAIWWLQPPPFDRCGELNAADCKFAEERILKVMDQWEERNR